MLDHLLPTASFFSSSSSSSSQFIFLRSTRSVNCILDCSQRWACVKFNCGFFLCSCSILSFRRTAYQNDWIAKRMKNSAKMQFHLFTQTNENVRIITHYRCHFRRDISSAVVGRRSACSRVASAALGVGYETPMSRRSQFPLSLSVRSVDTR